MRLRGQAIAMIVAAGGILLATHLPWYSTLGLQAILILAVGAMVFHGVHYSRWGSAITFGPPVSYRRAVFHPDDDPPALSAGGSVVALSTESVPASGVGPMPSYSPHRNAQFVYVPVRNRSVIARDLSVSAFIRFSDRDGQEIFSMSGRWATESQDQKREVVIEQRETLPHRGSEVLLDVAFRAETPFETTESGFEDVAYAFNNENRQVAWDLKHPDRRLADGVKVEIRVQGDASGAASYVLRLTDDGLRLDPS